MKKPNVRFFSARRFVCLGAALLALTGCLRPSVPLLAKGLSNPILHWDAADPCVVKGDDGALYVYSTSGCDRDGSLHLRVSHDRGATWRSLGYVLSPDGRPSWGGGCDFWAPEVHRIGDRYVAYYSARDKDRRFCIGAAVADSPAGPFEDTGTPLVRGGRLGLIDATYFLDPKSGEPFLVWKEDANDLRPKEPTRLMMARLSPDGTSLAGDAAEIMRNDQPWEGDLVEAPQLLHRGGWYYLFYSGNAFFDDRYGIGVARSKSPWGPYEKFAGNPIVSSDETFSGPGHPFLFDAGGGRWEMFYHARLKSDGGPARMLMVSDLSWGDDGWPCVREAQPR